MRSLNRVMSAVPGTCCVGERRFAEVSSLEQSGGLLKVLSNRAKVGVVAGLLHGDFDSSAVLVEQEVMDRALLIEAHGLRAAREHVAVMGVVIVPLSLRSHSELDGS